MPLSNAQYARIEREYQRRRDESRHLAEQHAAELAERLPEYETLRRKRLELMLEKGRVMLGGEGRPLKALEDEIKALTEKRDSLLADAGYPADYAEAKPFCPDCRDTGYIGSEKCHCFRKIRSDILYRGSALWNAVKRENFGTFDASLFSAEPMEALGGRSPRENILLYRGKAEAYAASFSRNAENLLLTGPAGTGKTFLCNCIAAELMKKDLAVLYLTASEFFDRMADNSFEREEEAAGFDEEVRTADLLILDDLGMELNNRFVQNAVFRTVNERLLGRRPTVISTNLSLNGIDERYSERVSSRIAGSYTVWRFAGPDIRIFAKVLSSER